MNKKWCLLLVLSTLLSALACGQSTPKASRVPKATPTAIDHLAAIPTGAVKMTPAEDHWPPVAISGWSKPVPLESPINSAGGEDSSFITLDGQTLYFFFTPDVRIPAEKQLLDGVTGIWVARWLDDGWGQPERVLLAGAGEVHLDGCPFVRGDWMAFCSARQGNYRDIDIFTATRIDGIWSDWQNWGKHMNEEYQVGELHVTADGQELYFSSPRAGGLGGYDLWVSRWISDEWGEPANLGAVVNTSADEGRPFVSADGQELWFDRMGSHRGYPGPAVFRSVRQPDGSWGKPEEIISSFAGEPTMTADGRTLYFVHHYYTADLSQMIEADIYVSQKP